MAGIFAVFSIVTCLGQPTRISSASASHSLHRVQPGEDLESLAERYLGDRSHLPELLAFNQIDNPDDVQPGWLLAIPGAIRAEALAAVQRAEAQLAQARQAEAEQFAAPSFGRAIQGFDQAQQSLARAEYAKCIGQADVTAGWARQAIDEAEAAARFPRDAELAALAGSVDVSLDKGTSWTPATAGQRLPAAARVRTASEARAKIVLRDAGTVVLTESSDVSIDQFDEDRRNGDVDIELRILLGDLVGDIEPKTRESTFTIKTKKARIAVFETWLRARFGDDETTWAEVMDGRATLLTDQRRIDIPAGHGVVYRGEDEPSGPIRLLPPPTIVQPPGTAYTTGVQRVQFMWATAASDRPAATYAVEVARDPAFLNIISRNQVETTEALSAVLPEGDYVWRVTAVDKHGLIGLPGEGRTLAVRPNLDVLIYYDGVLIDLGSGFVGGASNQYTARPARELTSVDRIEYSLDGSPYAELREPVRLHEEGRHILRMRGVSPDGRPGEPDTLQVRVDASGPRIRMSRRSPRRNPDGTESFDVLLDAFDPTGVDWVKVRVGKEPYQIYTGPVVLNPYRDSLLQYKARDVIGNESPAIEVLIEGEKGLRRNEAKRR